MAKEFDTVIRVGMNSVDMESSASEVNSKLRVLDSSFRAVQAEGRAFGETVDTLTKKQQILTDKIGIQTVRTSKLKEEYEKSRKETGENSRETEKLATRYNNAVKQLNYMEGDLKKVTKELGEQKTGFAKLTEESGEYIEAAKKVGKGMLAVLGAATALSAAAFKLTVDMGNYADTLLDLNDITGMSTDSIQEWRSAAVSAGTDIDTIIGASERLTKTLTAMDSETNKARKATEELGINFNKLSKMDADERMNILVEALQGVEDKTKRARIGTDLFSREWSKLAPIVGLGVEGLKEAKANANVFSNDDLQKANDFRVAFDELKYTFQQLGLSIGIDFAPYFQNVIEGIKVGMPEIKEKISNAMEVILPLIELFGKLIMFVGNNLKIIIPIVAMLGTVIAGLRIVNFATGVMSSFGAMNPVMIKTTAIIIGVVAALIALGVIIAVITGKKDDLTNSMKSIGDSVGNISGTVHNAQKPRVPGYATGVRNAPGGWAIVGEQGPELINLGEGGQDIYSNRDTKDILGRSGGDTYQLNVSMNEIDEVYKLVNVFKEFKQVKRGGFVDG